MDNSDNVIPLFKANASSEELQPMIETWQAMYLSHGQSLTDPKTAASLRVAIKVVSLLLKGACAHGIITDEQQELLESIVDVGADAADEWQK
ncbi:hypothetical protein [Streptomyces sp. NPDC058664]|uniref:hypothetical protein n=1 Tax=unclassified Streptomyces TaxID=2593676 RepID=UPI00364C9C47